MPRRIQERHGLAAFRRIHSARIRANRLGDAARLPSRHLGLADVIQQRRLAVIDVPHHSHHRWPRLKAVDVRLVDKVPRLLGAVPDTLINVQNIHAILLSHELDRLRVERGVDLHGQTLHEQFFHDIHRRHRQHLREVRHRHAVRPHLEDLLADRRRGQGLLLPLLLPRLTRFTPAS